MNKRSHWFTEKNSDWYANFNKKIYTFLKADVTKGFLQIAFCGKKMGESVSLFSQQIFIEHLVYTHCVIRVAGNYNVNKIQSKTRKGL